MEKLPVLFSFNGGNDALHDQIPRYFLLPRDDELLKSQILPQIIIPAEAGIQERLTI
jgi:hypothetical protein